MNIIKKIALVLTIIGAINWGLIGFFKFDLVAAIFGQMSILSRIIYALVGLSGLQKPPFKLSSCCCFTMLFQNFRSGLPCEAFTNSVRRGSSCCNHLDIPKCSNDLVLVNTCCQSSGVPVKVMDGIPHARRTTTYSK